jgi:hypothetical protein
MVTIPTIIAAIVVHWKDVPNWIFWCVIGFGIFAWLCGRTFITAVHDFEDGRETDVRVRRFWTTTANIVIWIQWLICIAAVTFSFIIPSKSHQAKIFKDSIIYLMKANEISSSLPTLQKTNASNLAEKEKQLLSLLQKSLESSKEINDEFLEKLHSQLPLFYKRKMIAGQELYIQGFKEKDPIKQMEAIDLLNEWHDYWEANGQLIGPKIENY